MNSVNVDIVGLVENNPLNKLSKNIDYGSKIVDKIKEKFNTYDQQLFIANFYCYLNCNKQDFVIDVDNIWKWIGYERKGKLKELLVKYFKENIDYIIEKNKHLSDKSSFPVGKAASPTGEAALSYEKAIDLSDIFSSPIGKTKNENINEIKGGSGLNRETIKLTVNCFKKLCLKADTKKANEIHDYYITLEETINDLIIEQSSILVNQLKIKDQEIKMNNVEKQKLLENTILEQFPVNEQCIYYGLVDDVSMKGERLIKFGQSNDLKTRIKDHKKTYTNFRLIKAYKVLNKLKIENHMKQHEALKKYIRSVIISDISYRELLAYETITLDVVDNIILDIIKEQEYNLENYEKILHENGDLKIENLRLKDEIKVLLEENKKLIDKSMLDHKETKEIQKNMTTNKATLGHYLYAYQCTIMRYKIGICRINNFEARELIYKNSNPEGTMVYKLRVENPFSDKILLFLAKENCQIVDKDTYECSFDTIKCIIDVTEKLEKLIMNYSSDIKHFCEKLDNFNDNIETVTENNSEEAVVHKSKRPIDHVDVKTGAILNSYPTLEAAGKALGVTGTAVGIAVRNKKLCKGYLFRYSGISKEDQYSDQPTIKINCKTGEQTKFKNIADSAREAGISAPAMRTRINTNVHVNNFHWVFDKEATHYVIK